MQKVGYDAHKNCGSCHSPLTSTDWTPGGDLLCRSCGSLVDCLHERRNLPREIRSVLGEVELELLGAASKFPGFNSAHEGYAVLLEEADELWDEVKKNQKVRSLAKMRSEAIQVSAMGARFVIDICDKGRNG